MDGHMTQEAGLERGDGQPLRLTVVPEGLQTLGIGEVAGEVIEAERGEFAARKLHLRGPVGERAVLLQSWFISEVQAGIRDNHAQAHSHSACRPSYTFGALARQP